jgi:hypothetical protein
MSWQEELDRLLAKLGVQQEASQPEPDPSEQEGFFFTQIARSCPGVIYRMDLAGSTPELRVFVPTEENQLKEHVYLVRLSQQSFLYHLFELYMTFEGGSEAFQEIEGATTFHLFQTMIETMKELFWRGDLSTLRFPPEIDVQCLTQGRKWWNDAGM